MDHIAPDVHSEIATDGAGLSFKGLGGTDQFAGTGNDAIAFPNHGHHGAGGDEIDQTRKEGTLLVDAVVLLRQGAAGGDLLQAHQLESLALEAAEDLAHQAALDAVGLDGDERAFGHGLV